MKQPVPDVTRADVDRVVVRDFAEPDRARVEAILADHGPLSPRVALAVLKLSDGDVAAVVRNLEAAREDWRDVVAWAEYPAYMKARPGSESLAGHRRDALVRADWEQYRSWLER